MWFATRHEGYDNALEGAHRDPVKAGSGMTATCMDLATRGFLRTGLTIQVLTLFALILSHYAFEGQGFYTWDLRHTTPEMRSNDTYRFFLLACNAAYLVGTTFICGFQCGLADDTAWARGYRAGSKLLGFATFFDLLSALIQLAASINFAYYYTDSYWTHFRSGNLDWIFGAGARVIHAVGFMLYGAAFMLLENYHDEGTNDMHGPLNFFLFVGSGILELSVLFLADPSFGIVFGLISLVSGCFWAYAFEEEVFNTSPAYHQSELCNELEREVDEFARRNPIVVQ